jgi:hypothetical protein
MSLKQEFQADLSQTFLDVDEFGEAMTFRITETGAEKEFAAPVIWDTESLKVRTIVQQQGVFLGTVLCFIATDWFAVEPKPEQVIYRLTRDEHHPSDYWEGWRIVDVVETETCFQLYLDKLIA